MKDEIFQRDNKKVEIDGKTEKCLIEYHKCMMKQLKKMIKYFKYIIYFHYGMENFPLNTKYEEVFEQPYILTLSDY